MFHINGIVCRGEIGKIGEFLRGSILSCHSSPSYVRQVSTVGEDSSNFTALWIFIVRIARVFMGHHGYSWGLQANKHPQIPIVTPEDFSPLSLSHLKFVELFNRIPGLVNIPKTMERSTTL